MLILRKGKKMIREYSSAYEAAADVNTLGAIFPAEQIPTVQRFLQRNAFSFSIRGAKARLGGGVILETVA